MSYLPEGKVVNMENIKICHIKNINMVINGINQLRIEKYQPKYVSKYADDTDFKIGYAMAKRINSTEKRRKGKSNGCKQI